MVSGDSWTTGAVSRASQTIATNIQFFYRPDVLLSPNQQCQSTEGKNITFHGLAYPKLTRVLSTLSLTTISSWLPWGRVAMPLISPLMPVPYSVHGHSEENKKSFPSQTVSQCDIHLLLLYSYSRCRTTLFVRI